jgi:hypothetical protein
MIQLISEYDLGCSDSEWCVKRVRNVIAQERLAEVNNFDRMQGQREVCRIGSGSDKVLGHAGL